MAFAAAQGRKDGGQLKQNTASVKQKNLTIRFPDLPANERAPELPERIQGYLTRKRKRLFNLNARKYYGSLVAGIFKLRRASERNVREVKLSSEYVIELDKESHLIRPVERSLFGVWKDAFARHRLYRQGQVREGLAPSSERSQDYQSGAAKISSRPSSPPRLRKPADAHQLVIAKLASPRRTPPRQQLAPPHAPQQSQAATVLQSQATAQHTTRRQSHHQKLHTAEDRSDKTVERLERTATIQKKIRALLVELKKSHELVKISAVNVDDSPEGKGGGSSSGSTEDEEDSDSPCELKEQIDGLPINGHRNLEETLSTTATPSSAAIEPIAKLIAGNGVNAEMSTKNLPTDKGPKATNDGNVKRNVEKPNHTKPTNVVEPAAAKLKDNVKDSGQQTKAKELLVASRELYEMLVELKQIYEELKLKVVKSDAGSADAIPSTTTAIPPPQPTESPPLLPDSKLIAAAIVAKKYSPSAIPLPVAKYSEERAQSEKVKKTLKKNGSAISSPKQSSLLVLQPPQQNGTQLKVASPPKVLIPQRVETKEEAPPSFVLHFYPPRTRRSALPSSQVELQAIPYSAVLKGRLPIWAYEPLNTLQMLCEELRFATDLLGKAVAETSATQRMAYVAAFVVSGYSILSTRKQKPFNPLRGETFDYISDDGWQFHAEQVSHHPPVSAAFAQHRDWEWHNCAKGEARFTLSGMGELIYKFPLTLVLHKYKEVYTWNKVKTVVINPLKCANKRVIRQEGLTTIQCTNGIECRLAFSNCAENTVSGGVYENRKIVFRLVGNWDKALSRVMENNQNERLFEAPPIVRELADRYYGFSAFSVGLNELHAEESPFLPATDTRFRPDQRFLEFGESQKATDAKLALEKNQRKRETQVPNFQPLWFQLANGRVAGLWQSNRRYWESRATKFQDNYSARMVRDLFKI